MECKRGWSSDFLAANFPLVFRNDTLRKHRRKVLFEREKTVLPAMQVYVGYKREMERLDKELEAHRAVFGSMYGADKDREGTVCKEYVAARDLVSHLATRVQHVKHEVHSLKQEIAGGVNRGANPEWNPRTELAAARARRKTLKQQLAAAEAALVPRKSLFLEMEKQMNTLNYERYRNQALYDDRWNGAGAAPAPERKEFIMKCPDEGCRGFLSSAYKCGTCAKWTCAACLVVLGAEKECGHTCDKDAVETAKTIKAETRPCPKCGTRIFKIDGCDQMFCVMEGCHTAFSWNTGHIVTGVIHNPHYYEWLRRTGGGQAPREAGDIPCGGLPTAWAFTNVLHYTELNFDERNRLLESHRYLRELIDWRLRDYPARAPASLNKEVDVQYLMNKIDETEWQRQLEFNEAKFRRKREIGQVLQMAATAASDILNRMLQQGQALGTGHADQFTEWIRTRGFPELDALLEFVNQSFRDLAKREHMAVPQFGSKWELKPIRALYRKKPASAGTKKGAAAAAGAAAAGVGLIGSVAEGDDDVVELLEDDDAANEIVELKH